MGSPASSTLERLRTLIPALDSIGGALCSRILRSVIGILLFRSPGSYFRSVQNRNCLKTIGLRDGPSPLHAQSLEVTLSELAMEFFRRRDAVECQALLRDVDQVLELTWEALHTGPWRDVNVAWRDTYSLAALLRAAAQVVRSPRFWGLNRKQRSRRGSRFLCVTSTFFSSHVYEGMHAVLVVSHNSRREL